MLEDMSFSRLVLQGDYVDMSVQPLTKSPSSKYYAFEVDVQQVDSTYYSYKTQEWYEYDTTFVHYAGGVFTDISNLGINLKKGNKYRIRCSIIEDREDKLRVDDGYVFRPFVKSGSVKINNAFVYGGEKMVVCNVDAIDIEGTESNFAPKVNRYYGEVIVDIVNENSAISINMERRNCGLHFLLTPPTEGILKVYQSYEPKFEYTLNTNSSSVNEEYVYALDLRNNYETLDIKVKWTKKDGDVIDLSPGKSKFYNKTMTTIKVDVNDRVGNSDIDINLDSEMNGNEIVVK